MVQDLDLRKCSGGKKRNKFVVHSLTNRKEELSVGRVLKIQTQEKRKGGKISSLVFMFRDSWFVRCVSSFIHFRVVRFVLPHHPWYWLVFRGRDGFLHSQVSYTGKQGCVLVPRSQGCKRPEKFIAQWIKFYLNGQ